MENFLNESDQEDCRLFVIDDHPAVRRGICNIVEECSQIEFCGEDEPHLEVIDTLEHLNPQVLVMDIAISNPQLEGLEFLKMLNTHFPQLKTLVFSKEKEKIYAEKALRAGALGYVMKNVNSDTILEAISKVARGDFYLNREIKTDILALYFQGQLEGRESPLRSLEVLSTREKEVFHLLGRGLTGKKIAQELNLSPKTVGTYFERMKKKLHFNTRRELFLYSLEWSEKRNDK